MHLGKREAFHEGRYSDLDKTAAAERQRGKAREAELCDNLAAEKARAVLRAATQENVMSAPLTAFATADARAAFRGPIIAPAPAR